MKMGRPPKSGWTMDIASIGARWLVGAFFIQMGFNKALHPGDFLKLLRQYEMVDTPFLLNSIAAALPWLEILCGLLLITGIAVRGSALTMIMLLVPFSVVVLHRALALQAQLGIPFCAVKFDCGCGAGEVFICRKLVENFVLLLLAAGLLAGRGRQLCLCYGLSRAHA